MNNDPVALARLVLGLTKEARHQEAVAPSRALIAATSPGDRMRLVAAEPIARAGRYDEAIALCDELIAAEPDAVQPLRLKAHLALREGREDQLVDALGRLFSLARTTIALNWIANTMEEAGWSDLAPDQLKERLTGHAQTSVPATFALLLVMLGRAAEAKPFLIKALNQVPNNADLLTAAAIAHAATKDFGQAQALSGKALSVRPFITSETENGQASLLTVVDLIKGYFSESNRLLGPHAYSAGNFPSEIRPGRIDIHKLQFQSMALDRAVREMPPIDVVLANLSWAGAEPPVGAIERFDTMVSELGAASLNHPRDHIAMSREGNFQRWSNAQEFIFPKTMLMTMVDGDHDVLASEIESEFDYPFIVRPPATQIGGGMELVTSAEMLSNTLATMHPGASFYVIQYHETVSDGGYYRKYRAAVIDGVPMPFRLDTRPHWMVHRQKNAPDYIVPTEAIEQEIAMQRDYKSALPETTVAAIERIASEAPLDIFGIDFGYAADGQVIVFETNAMMNLIPYRFADKHPHFTPVAVKLQTAIEDAVIRRKR